jgi:uncharacterized membrane protein YqiK
VDKTILSTFNGNLIVATRLPKLQEMNCERKGFQQVIHRKIGADSRWNTPEIGEFRQRKGRRVKRPTAR